MRIVVTEMDTAPRRPRGRPPVTEWPPGTRLVDHALRHAGPQPHTPQPDPGLVDVVRLVADQPELAAAWFGVHGEAEALFAAGLGAHFGEHPDSLRMRVCAAMLDGALRAGMEHAVRDGGAAHPDLTAAFRASLAELPF